MALELPVFDVTEHGAIGDGVADDRAAIMAAFTAARGAGGGTVYFPARTYRTSRYIPVIGTHDIDVVGPGATIVYPSGKSTVEADAIAVSDAQARSAFLLVRSHAIGFRKVTFRGDANEVSLALNIGRAVYATDCSDLHVEACTARHGAGLLHQDNLPRDLGARVIGNTIIGARGAMVCGSRAQIVANRFEVPPDPSYDRNGGQGSSHGIYLFAGRADVLIQGNTFQNIRTFAVKISGSVRPIRNVVVSNNVFDDCGGGVQWGADDAQEHSNAIIEGNLFSNCATNRHGWNTGQAIQVLGCRSVMIRGNGFHYDRDCDASVPVASVSAIQATRYASSGAPVESVIIEGNQFTSEIGHERASSPGAIATAVIDLGEVGAGSAFFPGQSQAFGAVAVRNNVAKTVGSLFLRGVRCVGLVVEGNEVVGIGTFANLVGCRTPKVGANALVPGPTAGYTSRNAQIRMNRCSFPIVEANHSMSRIKDSVGGKGLSVGDNASGSAPVDFPLLGTVGRHRPSNGLPEVVLAYGDGWADGDTVDIDGHVLRHKKTAPGPAEFDTPELLIARISALGNYTCVDYGSDFGVATHHLWIRRKASSAVGDLFSVAVIAAHPCAGVLLVNCENPANACFSRGEAPPAQNAIVIWSPLAHMWSLPIVLPDNPPASTLLESNTPWTASRLDRHSGSNLVVHLANTAAGNEQVRWGLLG